jgi:hypothetical protein
MVRRMGLSGLLSLLLIGLMSWPAAAADVTLAWDASARATGYRLSYGQASGSYHTVLDVGPALTVRVQGLTEDTEYFFAATAHTAAGTESLYSNEVRHTPVAMAPGVDRTPPTVRLTNPGNGARVKRSTTLTLTAYASDNVELVSVEFLVNGARRCLVLTVPYECRWAVPSSRTSTYTIDVLGTDTSHNIGRAATVRVTSR